MYTLFWEKLSGAIAPHVVLEELGVPYETYYVDMGAGQHRDSAYRALNPVMRVPALRLPSGRVIGETAAIILTLGEQNPATGLVPQPGDQDRPEFLFWLSAMAANGYPIFSRAWHPEQFTMEPEANKSVRQRAEEHLADFFSMLNAAISGDPFFLPRGFTALDVYLTMLTEWSVDRDALFAANPRIKALCEAVLARPSYQFVMDRHRKTEPA